MTLLTFPGFLKEFCICWDSGEQHNPSELVEMGEMLGIKKEGFGNSPKLT